jgi:hypothetical protein
MFRLVTGLIIAVFAASTGIAAPAEADAMLAQLSKIRLDKKQIYSVRNITLSRDVLSISLNRGTLAFTEAVDGKITGAVFLGSGDILAVPPDPIEKRQLFRYTKSALLNEHFETAVFRFTDNTYDDILKQYRTHAQETVDDEAVAALVQWESEMQRRSGFLNDRILEDLLGTPGHPFFLAQIEGAQRGWFDAIYDERRSEEVLIQQNTSVSNQPLVWASFNKRSEARDPAAFAHEDKLPYEIVSASDDGTTVRLKFKVDGERVLDLPPAAARVTDVTVEGGASLLSIQKSGRLAVVLPEPTRTGSEITLRVTYAPDDPGIRIRSILRTNAIAPASYRDEWIIEGLAAYAAIAASPEVLEQARLQLLESSPESVTYESLGPVYLGFRMAQPRTTVGYANAVRNKSVWIMNMLKNTLQASHGETAFNAFIEDLGKQFRDKTISTYDFKKLAEKHEGKPLDWFFDAWVFGTGIPSYKLESFKVEPAPGGGFVVSGNILQSEVPDIFEVPVPVYAGTLFLGNVNVASDGGEFRFRTGISPTEINLDPKKTLLRRDHETSRPK